MKAIHLQRMNRTVFILVLLTVLAGCNQSTPGEKSSSGSPDSVITEDADSIQRHYKAPVNPVHKFQNLADVLTKPDVWGNYVEDNTSILHFGQMDDTVLIEYYGQCWYAYPYRMENNAITVYWAEKKDCVFDIGFDKVKARPKPQTGKPFMQLSLKNDSTLKADYFYPDWIREFNGRLTGITAFPREFVCHKREY